MKKTLMFSIIIFFATLLHAQGVANKIETQETRETINRLLGDVQSARRDSLQLNRAIRKLGVQLQNNRNMKVHMSSATTANVTSQLVEIFNALDDQGMNSANKLRIIETIGFSDSSQLAQRFVLSLMDNGTEKQREMALWSLSPKGVHGDAVYKKIKGLITKGVIKEEDSYGYLKRADAKKALPEIQKFLSTTKNPRQFVGVGLLLSDYGDPALIDVLINRQEDFRVQEPGSAKDAIEHHEPAAAVSSDLLRKYIEVNEGEKVAKALRLFKKKGTSGDNDVPLLERKLRSTDKKTREAILDFLGNQVDGGNVSRDKALFLLDTAENTEKDIAVKTRIRDLRESVNKKNIRREN